MSKEMELVLDGESPVMEEIEEVVQENLKNEKAMNEKAKSKRGPKSPRKPTEPSESKAKEDKKNVINLKDARIIEREIKRGRLSAPCFRIEKTENGTYDLLHAEGIIFPEDAKGKYKKYDNTPKMVDGKWMVTLKAKELYGDKFKAKHQNGEEVEHQLVRFELHKPGREKDVVEVMTISRAIDLLNNKAKAEEKKKEKATKKEEAKLEEK